MDLWRYRELFFFLAWRAILVRYKQTVIGIDSAFVRLALVIVLFCCGFWQTGKGAFRRGSLSYFRSGRNAALAVFLQRFFSAKIYYKKTDSLLSE
ncbi:MAG TPA: hypothetical protein DCP92_17545 [Nitrospiraceae bacterium]|nr:hypothetical protein [Nitrospiraceae bacterium]